jgi:TRAP-type C4-dicarboxylate transport system substrate-binding protein
MPVTKLSGISAMTLAAVAATSASCAPAHNSGAADKAGGSRPPVVLRLANSNNTDQPDTETIEHFAAEVAKLSEGSLQVRITFLAAGSATPDVEERTIRMVQRGQFELGWVGARAWDQIGVKSFEALQSPFLVDSTNLLDRIVRSPMASEMLAGLRARGFVGLALVPDNLRHPIGITHQLVSLRDLRNARVRILPSRVTTALIRALGARPVEISNAQIGYELAGRRVDGEELALSNSPGNVIATGNVAFFAKTLTLFARSDVLAGLRDSDRRVLRAAAADTVRYAISTYPTDAELVHSGYCRTGRRIVLATDAERARLARAALPVETMLAADPATKRYIATIKRLKKETPRDPSHALPAACHGAVRTAGTGPWGALRNPSLLDGTYRWVLTAKDAHAWDPSQPRPGDTFPVIGVAVLRAGSWRFPPSGVTSDDDRGTYTIRGDRIRFVWPRVATVLNFRFARDRDGTVHLKPILPMDRGDQFVWAHSPWRRIGPPTLGR